MASSITTPTIRVSASMVIWFSVKSSAAMSAKAPMIDVGIATAAMKVVRTFHKNRKTTSAANSPPSNRCSWMAWSAASMNSD